MIPGRAGGPALLVAGLWGALAWADAPPPGRMSLLDAVRVTLSRQPEIELGRQSVQVSRGVTQAASGLFDTNLQAGISQRGDTQPLTAAQQALYGGQQSNTTYTTLYQAGLSKQLRFGMTIRPTVQVSRIAQSASDPASGQARINLAIIQPLLRGRGASSTAAQEMAARLGEEASLLQLRHIIAQRVQETALSYWTYVAAYQSIGIWQAAEERAGLLLVEEKRLVRAREHPAAELKKLEANLADATTARVSAERRTIEARQALGLAMGLGWREIEEVPSPTDRFSRVAAQALPEGRQVGALIDGALRRRCDRLAVQSSMRAVGVQVTGARRDLEPQLDLEVDLGYTGLSEGNGAGPFVTPLLDRVAGVNFYAGLSLQYPVENRTARGVLLQRVAGQERVRIAAADLERQIGASIALAVATLRAEAQGLLSAEAAAEAYREAVNNEKKRRRAGLSTIFDVLLTESRLTSAELAAVQARSRVAAALVRLRFETGTLIEGSGREAAIGAEQFTTLPPIK